MTKVVSVKSPFRIQGKGMTISEKTHAPLYWDYLPESNKRERVLDSAAGKWVGTRPKNILALDGNVESLASLAKTLLVEMNKPSNKEEIVDS